MKVVRINLDCRILGRKIVKIVKSLFQLHIGLELSIFFFKGAVPFHFRVPICDLWENGKIYDIDSCRDYNINYGVKKLILR
jgi:hypothetical protein